MIPAPSDNVFLGMKEQEFKLWLHGPITKAFFAFLRDQHANWRETAGELVENGAFRLGDPHEDRNPDVVRGKMLTLSMLQGIDLEHIQRFYGQEPEEISQKAQTDG